MKQPLHLSHYILLITIVVLVACKKENYVTPVVIQPPIINDQQLIPFGTLSIPREYVCAAAAGSKILFAGGAIQTSHHSLLLQG
jgi:hypothetical protein